MAVPATLLWTVTVGETDCTPWGITRRWEVGSLIRHERESELWGRGEWEEENCPDIEVSFVFFFYFIAQHSETVKTQTWQLYSPPTTGRKWLMAFDGSCASTKCSVNVSTAAPKRPEGFTGASRSAVFSESFNLVRASYRRRSSTTRFPLLQLIARAITFVALRARSMAWSSLKTSGSGPPSSRDLSSLAWYTWSIGIT